jgi:hypothetical protein
MVGWQSKPDKPPSGERMLLSLLTRELKRPTERSRKQLNEFIQIVKPETVSRWHWEIFAKSGFTIMMKQIFA